MIETTPDCMAIPSDGSNISTEEVLDGLTRKQVESKVKEVLEELVAEGRVRKTIRDDGEPEYQLLEGED